MSFPVVWDGPDRPSVQKLASGVARQLRLAMMVSLVCKPSYYGQLQASILKVLQTRESIENKPDWYVNEHTFGRSDLVELRYIRDSIWQPVLAYRATV